MKTAMAPVITILLFGPLLATVAQEQTNRAFFRMVQTGSPLQVHQAIRDGADVNARDALSGWTPLMAAASQNNNPEVVRVLLEAGADVAAMTAEGTTALMWAAMSNGNPDVIATLIEAGADVNAWDRDWWNHEHRTNVLMFAARHNKNPEVIATLIDAGADVNARGGGRGNELGWTALIWAANRNQSAEVTATLIEAGADVNAVDRTGSSALIYAVRFNRNHDVIIKLLDAGADGRLRDRNVKTAFVYARENAAITPGTEVYRRLADSVRLPDSRSSTTEQ